MSVLNSTSTYKYCRVSKVQGASLEVGPNRELVVDLASKSPPNYIILSDGTFRVMYKVGAGLSWKHLVYIL